MIITKANHVCWKEQPSILRDSLLCLYSNIFMVSASLVTLLSLHEACCMWVFHLPYLAIKKMWLPSNSSHSVAMVSILCFVLMYKFFYKYPCSHFSYSMLLFAFSYIFHRSLLYLRVLSIVFDSCGVCLHGKYFFGNSIEEIHSRIISLSLRSFRKE